LTEKTPSTGQFIGGLIAGFVLGGVLLMPIAVFGLMAFFAGLGLSDGLAFLVTYAVGAAIGFVGAWLSRVRRGFVCGLLIGLAAGLLGLTALCNVIAGAFGGIR
jgi:hypothetical protein